MRFTKKKESKRKKVKMSDNWKFWKSLINIGVIKPIGRKPHRGNMFGVDLADLLEDSKIFKRFFCHGK